MASNSIDAVRRFNRFYTGRIGLLPEDYLGSSHSLAEARVIFELGTRKGATATELGRDMGLDLGYLSRLLQGLKRRGLVQAKPSGDDARRRDLALTPRGQKTFQGLDARSRKEVGELLGTISSAERATLVGAMGTVERILGGKGKGRITLRSHRPGDMGYVVEAHGRLYAAEYGWDERFEALVAGIVSEYVQAYDPVRERCWIAEMDGERVGSVFLKKQSARTAKLRLLLIEPRARGLGLGRRLVDECIAFARAAGYGRMVLWTQSNLAAARHIYRATGFRLEKSYRHREFGYDLTGEYWSLKL
ncbi:MAG TPA: bifunctional helix-turn-helix transcriptional regulator/GNAT family N-acetyltransferase [Burkholderiales bacterium]|nr:bifunctional helix-turn-helix transcriptional regulator/GNAT family N-acetyltransferase [Burkholderiales bacterium]